MHELRINGANPGFHVAVLVSTLHSPTLIIEGAASKARYLQQDFQFVVPPQSEDDARFVSATDLLARIKACNFFK